MAPKPVKNITNTHPRRPTPAAQPTPHLSLEKLIQDHIPTATQTLQTLLMLLTSSTPLQTRTRRSLAVFERDLRTLCIRARDGVEKMDMELRVIEATWESVDKRRWQVCRRDYKVVMALVNQVWEAGKGRMEELRGVVAAAGGIGAGRSGVRR